MHSPCPQCGVGLIEHCPSNPRCDWRQCPDRMCRTVVDGKGRVFERSA